MNIADLIEQEISLQEVIHNYRLCEADHELLRDTMIKMHHNMIRKFILGAKEHPLPLVHKATTHDILSELYDGIFYTTALEKRHENKQ